MTYYVNLKQIKEELKDFNDQLQVTSNFLANKVPNWFLFKFFTIKEIGGLFSVHRSKLIITNHLTKTSKTYKMLDQQIKIKTNKFWQEEIFGTSNQWLDLLKQIINKALEHKFYVVEMKYLPNTYCYFVHYDDLFYIVTLNNLQTLNWHEDLHDGFLIHANELNTLKQLVITSKTIGWNEVDYDLVDKNGVKGDVGTTVVADFTFIKELNKQEWKVIGSIVDLIYNDPTLVIHANNRNLIGNNVDLFKHFICFDNGINLYPNLLKTNTTPDNKVRKYFKKTPIWDGILTLKDKENQMLHPHKYSMPLFYFDHTNSLCLEPYYQFLTWLKNLENVVDNEDEFKKLLAQSYLTTNNQVSYLQAVKTKQEDDQANYLSKRF